MKLRHFTKPLAFERLEARRCLTAVAFITHEVATEGFADVSPADMDGDGDIDLVFASLFDGLAWYENTDGKGTFSNMHVISRSVSRPEFVVAADLDSDGDSDVLLYEQHPVYGVSWYENLDSRGNFAEPKTIQSSRQEVLHVISLSVADLDGDGDSDVLASYNDLCHGGLVWYENVDAQFQSTHLETNFLVPPGEGRSPAAPGTSDPVDFDGDGDLDVLTTRCVQESGVAIAWHDNSDGNGGFAERVIAEPNERFFFDDLLPLDVDSDGDHDLVAIVSIVGIDTRSEVHWYENEQGTWSFEEPIVIDTQPQGVGAAFVWLESDDVDRDGDPDLLAVSRNRGVLYYENAEVTGHFGQPQLIINGGSHKPLSIADIDADGAPDVLSSVFGKIRWSEQVIVGDSNHDDKFNQLDIVQVLQGAKYLTGEPAGFEEGDWNNDGVFDQVDIVAALQTGNYLQVPLPAHAVDAAIADHV